MTTIRLKGSLSIALSLALAPTMAMARSIDPTNKRVDLGGNIAQYEHPDNLGKPRIYTGGGTQQINLQCNSDDYLQLLLTPLMPLLAPYVQSAGVTVSEHPEFFVYVPQTSATEAEFVLGDEENNDIIYQTNLPLSGEPGIVSVRLPEELPPLEVGKNYHWYFEVVCNPDDRTEDLVVKGWSQRRELEADLATKLEVATTARDRSFLYAKNGIWHDSLSILADEIRNSNGNALAMAQSQWKLLLESAGLDKFTEVPLINTSDSF